MRTCIGRRTDNVAGDVTEIGAGVHLSLSALAQEFGCARETLKKRLAAADVRPAGEHRGNSVWRLRDAFQAWVVCPEANIGPEALPPAARKAHYQALREEILYRQECGDLVPVDQYREELGRVAKAIGLFMDTLPDQIERRCGLSGHQVTVVVEQVAKLRDELAIEFAADPDDEEHAADAG